MALESDVVTTVAPILKGNWFHDPDDPEGTVIRFAYHEGNARAETQEALGTSFLMSGRKYAVWEFGEHETRDISLPLMIPFDSNYDASIAFLYELIRQKKAWVYRDKRARLVLGVAASIALTDLAVGTAASFTVSATDFVEEIS